MRLSELLLALTTDQPLNADEKREVALAVLRMVRQLRQVQGLPDSGRSDFRDN